MLTCARFQPARKVGFRPVAKNLKPAYNRSSQPQRLPVAGINVTDITVAEWISVVPKNPGSQIPSISRVFDQRTEQILNLFGLSLGVGELITGIDNSLSTGY